MILAISGLSGSGKTTIAKKLSEQINFPIITTCTTRPMRPGEEHGKDYYFMTDEDFSNESILAEEHFNVAGGHIWKYGIREKDVCKNNCIVVLTPKGIADLKKSKHEILDIMVTVEDSIRKKRIFDRKDNQSIDEIERRDRDDKAIFKNYKPMMEINNDNRDIDDTIKTLQKMIIFYKK